MPITKQSRPIGMQDAVRLPESPRLKRMRLLSRLLDNSIVLPGGYRIGIDPLLGLIPAVGDAIGAALSLWIVYDAALLGTPKRILARMVGNVLVETLAGSIPAVGDLFDAVWKANARNMRLVELHYAGGRPERDPKKILLIFAAAAMVLIGGVFFLALWMFKMVLSLFS
jgi:hypothetical protein